VENSFQYNCQKNWWQNLLYVNNLVDIPHMCLGQTWYLACDMQMYAFAPLILFPLYHWPVLGQLLIILFICFFTGINAMITVIYNLGPNGGDPDGDPNDAYLRYMKPWCRAMPYLVGLYMGWVLHKIRGRKIHIPAPLVAIGWITSALTACLVVYGLYDYTAQGIPQPKTVLIIFPMLDRTAWAVCLAWVVFACVTGYGGVVNSILSWKPFIPLSRLTYCSYLVSIDVQTFYWNTQRTAMHIDQTVAVYIFLATLPVIFCVALLFSLAFESPMIALEKIMFAPLLNPPRRAEKPAEPANAVTAPDGTAPGPAEVSGSEQTAAAEVGGLGNGQVNAGFEADGAVVGADESPLLEGGEGSAGDGQKADEPASGDGAV